MTSVAWPWNPPDSWRIVIRAFRSADLKSAVSRSEPTDAA
jgi:hypothetical protein